MNSVYRWWLRLRLRRLDGGLLLALLAPLLLDADAARPGPSTAVAAVIAAGLAVSRAAPVWSLAVAAGLSGFALLDGAGLAAPLIASAVLSFLAGCRMAEPRQATYAFGAVAVLICALVLGSITAWVTVLLFQFLSALLPWWAGSSLRQRRELRRAEAARVEQARLRERARIAQDMHDSLGHELSLLALVAGGLELAPDLSERHRATASQLRAGAVSATERLHEIIGLLGEKPDVGEDDIADVVRRAREAGLRAGFEQRGTPPEAWPAATRLAARRVIQEALTNAVRHAPGAEVTVRVTHGKEETVVSVANRAVDRADAGPRPPAGNARGSGGTGLIGLDERVRLAGGVLRAGPREGGGFEVTARLPHAPGDAAAAEPDVPPRRERRALLRISALPLAVAAALGAFMIGSYVYTVQTTALGHRDFERLRLGQSRAEIAGLLPSHAVAEPPPVLSGPSAPPGARCEFYRAGTNLLDLSGAMYRLCFRDGVLVAKDSLRQGVGT